MEGLSGFLGGSLWCFWGPGDQKVEIWPVAVLPDFGVAFWVYDPGRFFGLMTLAIFWGCGAWKPIFMKKTTKPGEFRVLVCEV